MLRAGSGASFHAAEMASLTSFGKSFNAAVIGASGGIGRALVENLTMQPGLQSVIALSRQVIPECHPKISKVTLTLQDEASIAAAAETVRAQCGTLDMVIVASGILHDGAAIQPEKTWRAIDPVAFAKVLASNTIGPALIAKHFLPLLPRDRRATFAVLSARVGSIGDNALGGWYAYRASKAALNMLVKTLSIELKRRNPEAICVSLHPGTVATMLSQPFQGGVPAERVFPPSRAAAQLLSVIDTRTAGDSGGFFAWDGSRIPF